MTTREFYEVVPDHGEAGGYHVVRNGLVKKWHADLIDAVLDGVERAVREMQEGKLTSLRVKGKDGRILHERAYTPGA